MSKNNRVADRRVDTSFSKAEAKVRADNQMGIWLREMSLSDTDMSRGQEDLLTHLIEDHGYGNLIHPILKAKWDRKKELRSRSPR